MKSTFRLYYLGDALSLASTGSAISSNPTGHSSRLNGGICSGTGSGAYQISVVARFDQHKGRVWRVSWNITAKVDFRRLVRITELICQCVDGTAIACDIDFAVKFFEALNFRHGISMLLVSSGSLC
ncbi:unnamed protein product [Protopolystoma xenopodis]|uniref:Uncharacterized protein n=1 Tax=Protopolystoma xenopodis TaxID=117903 RepID=A0A3S5BTC6_9PLAT|nr:unnamed protein product [Protopolystoma xenopodis]